MALPRIIKPIDNHNDLAIVLAYYSSDSKSYSYSRGKYGKLTIYINDDVLEYRIEKDIYEMFFGNGLVFKAIENGKILTAMRSFKMTTNCTLQEAKTFIFQLKVEVHKLPRKCQLFNDEDFQKAIDEGIFNSQNEVTANTLQVISFFQKWCELKCKETAKNVRHKVAELVAGNSSLHTMLHNEIMNIRYDDVKPKIQ